jgi:hypothetical protein
MEKTWKNVFFGGGTDMAVFCPNKRQDGMDIACRPVFLPATSWTSEGIQAILAIQTNGFKLAFRLSL